MVLHQVGMPFHYVIDMSVCPPYSYFMVLETMVREEARFSHHTR